MLPILLELGEYLRHQNDKFLLSHSVFCLDILKSHFICVGGSYIPCPSTPLVRTQCPSAPEASKFLTSFGIRAHEILAAIYLTIS